MLFSISRRGCNRFVKRLVGNDGMSVVDAVCIERMKRQPYANMIEALHKARFTWILSLCGFEIFIFKVFNDLLFYVFDTVPVNQWRRI